jgi:hypothetical protein
VYSILLDLSEVFFFPSGFLTMFFILVDLTKLSFILKDFLHCILFWFEIHYTYSVVSHLKNVFNFKKDVRVGSQEGV